MLIRDVNLTFSEVLKSTNQLLSTTIWDIIEAISQCLDQLLWNQSSTLSLSPILSFGE